MAFPAGNNDFYNVLAKNSKDDNVGITIINHPFGNGLYQLSMVIWGMVYYCYTHVDFAIAMEAIKLDD